MDQPLRNASVVFDIGKTNAKLTLLDDQANILDERRCPNLMLNTAPYPQHDTERLWDWLLATLSSFSQRAHISAIVPVTHGATCALVDAEGLVLPVLDYESTLPQTLDAQYQAIRPPFAASLSPDLPAGLNLGRQLFWLAQAFPAEFGRAQHILTYPQYWAWRLSGVAASEVSSLGCHTDLWQPEQAAYSSLVPAMGWSGLFPPLQPAWARLGPIRAQLMARTGLAADCQILCGIHDSNASLLRYLFESGLETESKTESDPESEAGRAAAAPTVLSTGTWLIAAALGKTSGILRESLDMLANVNVFGQPVPCMRFMGGREFAALAGHEPKPCSVADLARLLGQGTLALPGFAESGGPFFGQAGAIAGPAPQSAQESYALATLYCVLMSDYCLAALEVAGPVVVEGSFTDNPYFSALLAALRPQQTIRCSNDASGTTGGGWMLHHWGQAPPGLGGEFVQPLALAGLQAYRQRWLELVAGRQQALS